MSCADRIEKVTKDIQAMSDKAAEHIATLTARLSAAEQREREAVAYAERLRGILRHIECESINAEHMAQEALEITPPKAIAYLRQQHMELCAKECDSIQRKHEDAAKREDDVEERAFREGESCGAEDCAAAIRRLAQQEMAQGEGKEGEV